MTHSDRAEFAASLVRVVALHDKDTASHLWATATLAGQISRQMQFPQPMTETIELAALLHDIGKLSVRRDVLRKRSELSRNEWDEMRLHAEAGANLLENTPVLAHVAPIVRAHHERIDGGGYPDRLRGDDIPLEARVVAVADAFHALTTDRPYRQAIGVGSALHVLAGAAGPAVRYRCCQRDIRACYRSTTGAPLECIAQQMWAYLKAGKLNFRILA